jgi:hypothetical protein
MRNFVDTVMSMRAINECNEGAIVGLCSELSNVAKTLKDSSTLQVLRMHLLKNFSQYDWTPKHGVNLEKFKTLVSLGNASLMPDHQLNALIDMTNTNKIEHSYFAIQWMSKLDDFAPAHDASIGA